ncbi:RPM1-interacting protein 4-like isoform X2 [Arachis stenosperma]|uniref:RPM1-interacting protein 4-like isoform X2 n=1 Tax=Arachis stenosperma TaxID=217475 RepID=UPI0025AD7DF3|nr:RPM1-interacting protein 4-like isoform X2 [Arachis stenosperma]
MSFIGFQNKNIQEKLCNHRCFVLIGLKLLIITPQRLVGFFSLLCEVQTQLFEGADMALSHVPKIGNWESDNVPYTAHFENARRERGVVMLNPNDPMQNPEAFNTSSHTQRSRGSRSFISESGSERSHGVITTRAIVASLLQVIVDTSGSHSFNDPRMNHEQ